MAKATQTTKTKKTTTKVSFKSPFSKSSSKSSSGTITCPRCKYKFKK